MFDSLSDRLQGVFRSLRGEARLTEQTVEAALREIRMALLEADVNFKVVKAFIDRVRDRAVDQEVLQEPDARRSRSSASSATRCWRCSATRRAGCRRRRRGRGSSCCSACRGRARRRPPGKLGRWLAKQGRHPLLVSTDVRRPAAIEQLSVVGEAGGRARPRSGRRDGSGQARERRADRSAQRRVRRRHRRHRRAGCTSTTS